MRLRQVLAGATFPAERWELLAWADYYGADCVSKRQLHDLRPGSYQSIDLVLDNIKNGG